MSLANDLHEREHLAGNADDGLGIGQQQYEERFNRAANKSQEEIDDEFAGIIDSNYGEDRGTTKIDAHGDKVQRNWNADEPLSAAEKAKSEEENPGSLYRKSSPKNEKTKIKSTFRSRFKRFGPGIFIAGFLGGGVGLGGTILIPAALGPMLDRVLTNYGADDTRTNIMMRRGYVGGLFSKRSGCSGAPVMCRVTTMSSTQKEAWEKKGFTVTTADAGNGRFAVDTIKFPEPDGTEVKSGRELQAHISKNPNARQLVHNVLHPKASSFIDPKAKFRKVLAKYGLAHGKIFRASLDRDKTARTQAMNESIDRHNNVTPGDASARAKGYRSKAEGKASAAIGRHSQKIKRVSNPADAAVVACAAYNITRASIAVTKLLWYEDLIKFAFPFIQTFAQQLDQGNVEPERVEYINDRLTWYDKRPEDESGNPNPKYNLTALDSQGLKMALYGDFDALHEFTKPYTTWWMTAAVVGSGVVGEVEDKIGKENLRNFCLTAQGASLAGMALCANPIGFVVCGSLAAVFYFSSGAIVEEAMNMIMEPAMERMANADLTSNLKGVDAGNALAAGIGLLLTEKSRGSGLRPATNLDQVKKYITATDQAYYEEIEELPRIAAKKSLFDLSNQYSFASQVVKQIEQRTVNSNTPYDLFANTLAVNISALAITGSSASALYHQPNELTNREGALEPALSYDRCEDQELKDIKVLCDYTGRPISVLSENAIDMMNSYADDDVSVLENNFTYMINGDFIDSNGKEKQKGDNGEDNEYVMYKRYCTEDREFPIGVTDKSLDDAMKDQAKFEWYIGSRCAGNDVQGKPLGQDFQLMLDNFFFFYHTCETQFALAEQADGCWTDASTPPATTVPTNGDWVIPTSGPCTSSFGARWQTTHNGIDLAPPKGTAVVAPTNMKVTRVFNNGVEGDSTSGGGFGSYVYADATDGSGESFIFAHMIAGSIPVQVGQDVAKGTKIGEVGHTGDSTGPHLHFEISKKDPVPILAQHGVQISCSVNQ